MNRPFWLNIVMVQAFLLPPVALGGYFAGKIAKQFSLGFLPGLGIGIGLEVPLIAAWIILWSAMNWLREPRKSS